MITYRHRTETEFEVSKMSSRDQANRGEKLALVWRNNKKISQIINDYLYWDQPKRWLKLGLVWKNRKKIIQIINDYLYWD
jgi:hypothetical protein